MKKNSLHLLVCCFLTNFSFSQIPIDDYRAEIQDLKSESQLKNYWNKLEKIDQDILVNITNLKAADSLSIPNMIRTSLLFDIHGIDAYKPNNVLPIFNLSHNYIEQSQIAFWPIIEKCASVGGVIQSFGGKYPAYQLESVSLTFYNYSLINQELKYPNLIDKLRKIERNNMIDDLSKSYQYQNKLRELKEIKILNSWYRQSFKDRKDIDIFSIVMMSDDSPYLKNFGRIQRLNSIETKPDSKIYQIENEPFGWTYIYGNNGSLTLIDNKKNELITYTLAN